MGEEKLAVYAIRKNAHVNYDYLNDHNALKVAALIDELKEKQEHMDSMIKAGYIVGE